MIVIIQQQQPHQYWNDRGNETPLLFVNCFSPLLVFQRRENMFSPDRGTRIDEWKIHTLNTRIIYRPFHVLRSETSPNRSTFGAGLIFSDFEHDMLRNTRFLCLKGHMSKKR